MANENMIKFLRGNVADLPQTATAGALYFTKDEGVYLGLENGSYHRYGDFITVADVNSLPAAGAHETCMYYCTSENILARYDSAKGWIQINKQPTAEEMKTLLGLGSLAYKTEVAESDLNADLKAKVNAAAEGNHSHDNKALLDTYTQTETDLADAVAKKHEHANAAELVKIADGDVAKWNAAEQNAKDYADGLADNYAAAEHTHTKDEITDFTHTHTAAEVTDLDAIIKAYDYATKAEAQGYADAKDEAIAAAKKAGDDAQADVDALAGKVGEVPADKTVVQMIADAKTEATYDDTEVRGLISDNTNAIAVEKERAEGIEADLQTQINTIMNNPDTEGVINSINEFTQYIADHGEIAEGFRTDIDKNKEDIAANAKAIADQATSDAATYETKTDASDKLTEAKTYADGLNTAMDTRVKELEAIDHEAYVAADTALKTELQKEIDDDVQALADTVYTKTEVEAFLTWGTFGE